MNSIRFNQALALIERFEHNGDCFRQLRPCQTRLSVVARIWKENITTFGTPRQSQEFGCVSESGARVLVAYSPPPEPKAPDQLDTHPCLG
jgi:hypothetical protein